MKRKSVANGDRASAAEQTPGGLEAAGEPGAGAGTPVVEAGGDPAAERGVEPEGVGGGAEAKDGGFGAGEPVQGEKAGAGELVDAGHQRGAGVPPPMAAKIENTPSTSA